MQGEAAFGGARPPVPATTMTLHEALVLIFRENNNTPMTVRQLTDAVNERSPAGAMPVAGTCCCWPHGVLSRSRDLQPRGLGAAG